MVPEADTPAWWQARTLRTHLEAEARRRKLDQPSCGCSLCRDWDGVPLPPPPGTSVSGFDPPQSEVRRAIKNDGLEAEMPVSLPLPSPNQEKAVKHPQGRRHWKALEAMGDWLGERRGLSARKLAEEVEKEKGLRVSWVTLWRFRKKRKGSDEPNAVEMAG